MSTICSPLMQAAIGCHKLCWRNTSRIAAVHETVLDPRVWQRPSRYTRLRHATLLGCGLRRHCDQEDGDGTVGLANLFSSIGMDCCICSI